MNNAERRQKTLQELDLADDFLFAKVMRDREICRRVLELLLGIPVRSAELLEFQKTIRSSYGGKEIRLDVYAVDEDGTVYNAEMQQVRKENLSRRARYYQGDIDLNLILAGENYRKLKKAFVIFICCFDPFGKGRHRYTFEKRCLEDLSLSMGDGTATVFLNTRGTMDDVSGELLEFLAYVEETTDAFAEQAESRLVKDIHRQVCWVKESRETEVEYMTLMERYREQREEGYEDGREEGKAEVLVNCLRLGKSSQEIAEILGLPLSEVEIMRNRVAEEQNL